MKSRPLMNQNVIEKLSARNTGNAVARLGARHGYRFNADTVRLSAMFTVVDAAAHKQNWALQLWACPNVPSSRNDLNGQLVAQVALPPIGEVADEAESFEITAPAVLPAGNAEFVMVLALVAGKGREFNEVHDLAVYPRRETFLHPRFTGAAGYRIEGGRVVLSAECIENPRCADNLSGSLSLELWALPTRFNGGAFQGQPLAGVAFDALAGQYEYRNRSFNLPFVAPAAGKWNLVLMLREWTATGFVTRDYVNFDQPFVQPESRKVEAPTPAVVVPPPLPSRNATQRNNQVSVNTASVEDLSNVKGMPEKVAKVIVKERPFRSLDDLTRVKGMGAKLLARIRASLKL